MPRWPAVIASGLFFTLHHVIALTAYFDWRITTLASLGVFIGGATWSWIYLKYRNIYAAYVSHVFADIVIFAIGYKLIFGA
jgi:membrane protease YdiL (CAAX protease family)